jgi:osmoprotectant transport system substrate-binding protein
VCLLALAGCLLQTAFAGDKEPITVGSKIDTEGALLGKMILLLLKDAGLEAVDKTEFGTTPIVRKAIKAGQIDIYPEYTGNGAFFFQDVDPSIWRKPEAAYAKVKALDLERNGLVWLKPAPANNTWAIAVRRDVAEEHGLKTLEDFAELARQGGRIKLAGCEEFVNRADALPAFQKAYSFSLTSQQLLVFSGCNTAQTEKAAARGTSGVNFAMAFGTDGALSALDLRVLEDTKNVQPVYEPAPLVRREVMERSPRIEDILNPVFASLDLETLQSLNARIAVQGRPAEQVARDYLSKKGWLQ